ncbi:AbrB family transcriptional regulator [Ammoniphilus resinae]|uniref:Membrane AbrB-like protein n=1 Tax=Ammoniphilus resinae TaxID=861532 RepID=A0ABS4GLU3_9BACL|nr:AbrB family transcriptional regulator [Ammoniphilus resinae]MBP1931221.1 membrane AbrB-like protein [Ammoniphilus resinae]
MKLPYSLFETFLVSLLGGLIFYFLTIPLAWLLGPLTATMLWKLLTKRKLCWPSKFRDLGMMVLGYMLGSSFTWGTLTQITYQLPSMLIVTILTIGFSFFMGYLVVKGARVDFVSGIIGSVPGGLSQMVILGEELKGVDTTIVTFMQTFRLMIVIFTVPFILGHGWLGEIGLRTEVTPTEVKSSFLLSWYAYPIYLFIVWIGARLGKKIGLPTAPLLGPLLLTAGFVLAGIQAPPLPSFIILSAQILVGAYIGLMMNFSSLSNWRRFAPYTIFSCFALVGFSLLLGWLITLFYSMSLYTAVLATTPGGIAEMGVTAHEVNANLSMVAAYQIFRVLFILFLVPPFLKWFINKVRASSMAKIGEQRMEKTRI